MFWMGVSGFLFVILGVLLIRSWLMARAKRGVTSAVIPRRHGLFRFSDGVKVLEIDPIEVFTALDAHREFRFDLHIQRVQDGESEAIKIVSSAVREAFKVPAFVRSGEPGLTNRECWELLCAFLHYCESQKKSTNPLPISAPSTDAISETSENKTTPNTLGSGSIDGGLRTSLGTQ